MDVCQTIQHYIPEGKYLLSHLKFPGGHNIQKIERNYKIKDVCSIDGEGDNK